MIQVIKAIVYETNKPVRLLVDDDVKAGDRYIYLRRGRNEWIFTYHNIPSIFIRDKYSPLKTVIMILKD